MKIILTGKSGLIGSAVYERLVDDGHSVISIGRRDSDYEMDLNFFKPVYQELSCDIFIHCAGVTDEEILKDKRNAIRRATAETVALWDWAVSLKPAKIVYISTAHVYGDLNKTINEQSNTTPKSLYAMLHLFCEQYLKSLGGHYLVLRPLTGFGKVSKNFNRWDLIPFSFPKSLATKQRIEINTHGKQYRNFVSTTTIANIISEEINVKDSKIINPVGPHNMSVIDFATYCVETVRLLSEHQLEVIVKKNMEYVNNFKYLSNYKYHNEHNDLLKSHIINIYQQSKGDI